MPNTGTLVTNTADLGSASLISLVAFFFSVFFFILAFVEQARTSRTLTKIEQKVEGISGQTEDIRNKLLDALLREHGVSGRLELFEQRLRTTAEEVVNRVAAGMRDVAGTGQQETVDLVRRRLGDLQSELLATRREFAMAVRDAAVIPSMVVESSAARAILSNMQPGQPITAQLLSKHLAMSEKLLGRTLDALVEIGLVAKAIDEFEHEGFILSDYGAALSQILSVTPIGA